MLGDVAPVALFAYRRPDHLRATLGSLAGCPEAIRTAVTVFCDGPRSDEDAAAVAEVLSVAREAAGFGSVRVIERPQNLGLAGNVVAGVTQVVEESGTVVVLEDDMVVSHDFLRYLNDALTMYAGDDRVVSIHGYVYPTTEALPPSFFLRGADCWGWATWERGWRVFEPDGALLLERLRAAHLGREFDFDGAYPYTQMLADQVAGRVDSWAVRWYASAFLADRLTLYPGRSLVSNIGLDGSGTHSLGERGLATETHRIEMLARVPVEESREAREIVARALRAQGARGRRRWSPAWPRRRRA